MTRENTNRRSQTGFGLFELMLVVLIITIGMVFEIQRQASERERSIARVAGQEMKIVMEAVNAAIVNNHPTYTAAASITLTIGDLRAQALLPATFADTNIYGQAYVIRLVRTGTAPNWNIEGLVLTQTPLTVNGASRLDLAGVAIEEVGANGGMTYDASEISGHHGGWTAPATTYPGITAAAQFGGRVSYSASQMSQFLRRDGTLPMTGNLNMGGQSITSAQNVTAAGTVTANDAVLGDASITSRSGKRLSYMLPALVEIGSYVVNNDTLVPKPTCGAGGSQQIFIIPQVYNTSDGYFNFYAQNVDASNWRAKLVNGANAALGTGLARTFCSYPLP